MGFDITPPKKRRPLKQPQARPMPHPTAPKTATSQSSRQPNPKRKKGFGAFLFVFMLLALIAVGVYLLRQGYIALPERTDDTSNATNDTAIVTTFSGTNLVEDFEKEEVEDEGIDVVNDPLMSAHFDFVQMVQSLPEAPEPAGYDVREVQLLNTYINDF